MFLSNILSRADRFSLKKGDLQTVHSHHCKPLRGTKPHHQQSQSRPVSCSKLNVTFQGKKHKNEGYKNEGYKNEGYKNEGYKNEGSADENQLRRANSTELKANTRAQRSVPCNEVV
jgi:hypothetical protein